jgi:hypothetical protein
LSAVLQRQHSDDDSDVLLRRGTVLYDFSPEEEDEVSVSRGEAVEIEYEVGGWIQVRGFEIVCACLKRETLCEGCLWFGAYYSWVGVGTCVL